MDELLVHVAVPRLPRGAAISAFSGPSTIVTEAEEDAPVSPDADVLVLNRPVPGLRGWARPGRLLLSFAAGVDHFPLRQLAEAGVTIANSRGAHAVQVAEHVVAGMLAFERNLPTFIHQQAERRWLPTSIGELASRTVGLYGLGTIGQRIARLVRAFDCRVVACRRGESTMEGVSWRNLAELAEEADYLVATVPLTAETRGSVNAAVLDRLGPKGVLVNVGRGAVVDERALMERLRDGRLRGALLDVFSEEPLPATSPFWSLPNVIITPHHAGSSPHYHGRVLAVLRQNLLDWLAGRPPPNLIDPWRGY